MKIRMRILDSYHSIRLITYSQSFQQTCSRFEKANVKVAFCFNSYTYYYPRSILKKYNHFKIAFASFLRHKQKYREPKLRRIIQNVVLLTLNSDKSFESFEKEILERTKHFWFGGEQRAGKIFLRQLCEYEKSYKFTDDELRTINLFKTVIQRLFKLI